MEESLYATYKALLESGETTLSGLAKRRGLKRGTVREQVRALVRTELAKPIPVYEGFGKRGEFLYKAVQRVTRDGFGKFVKRMGEKSHSGLNIELVTIAKICAGILKLKFKGVKRVVLYGSVARRRAKEGSDVDLLVVVDDGLTESLGDLTDRFVDALYNLELASGRYVEPIVVKESDLLRGGEWHFFRRALAEGVEL